MEKKLLLLGMLRSHDMHGYQLNELLAKNLGLAITLKRSNAYKLLNKMEIDGWITYHEEREGKHPTRRVYTITAEGEEVFQRLLRESLVAYPPPEFPSLVPYDFLGALAPDEATALLKERRRKVEARFDQLDAIPEDVRERHPSFEYLHHYYAAELEWMDNLTERLNTAPAVASQTHL